MRPLPNGSNRTCACPHMSKCPSERGLETLNHEPDAAKQTVGAPTWVLYLLQVCGALRVAQARKTAHKTPHQEATK